jgi:dipeptidyl aminopeptidase/acylaminoacyl peptidase
MNKHITRLGILLMVFLLAGCARAWNRVILPSQCRNYSFSPRLDQVLYECDDGLRLASLPNLEDATLISIPGDASARWSGYGWRPDGQAILLSSYKPAGDTEDEWLVEANDLEAKTHLCTLPVRERIIRWSPTGNSYALIERGGDVTLVHTDGSGCAEMPIPGMVMKSPSLSWSPDGQRIAYTYVPYPEGLDAGEVRVIDVTTYQTSTIYSKGGLPAWWPDGKEIALFGWDNIPVIDANGSGEIGEIKIPKGYMTEPAGENAWSPDGSRWAIYLRNDGPDYKPVAIGIVDRKSLTLSAFEIDPTITTILSWTSDGNALIVYSIEKDGTHAVSRIPVAH